jgi:transposase
MLSDFLRGQIIGAYNICGCARLVARKLGLTLSVVQRWIKRYEQSGAANRAPGSGGPRKTTARADRLLFRLARANGFATCRELLHKWQQKVSRHTVIRRLRDRHLRQYRPCRVPLLSRNNVKARLDWAMRRCHWRQQWKRVIWTDESRFLLRPVDGRTRVWRLPGERFSKSAVVQVTAHGGGSVHVWGAIWKGGRSDLIHLRETVNADRYCEVLHDFFCSAAPPAHALFQQDNAPAHRSWLTQMFLESLDVPLLPWPACSPDLNPIENVWDMLGRRMLQRECQNLNHLFCALREEWHLIPQEDLDALIASLPRRVGMVIAKKGGSTRY